MVPKLLTIAEAAAALGPHVAPISGLNVLADWRRSQQHYRPCSNHIPRFVRVSGRIFYPDEEIARTIAGVQIFKMKQAA